MSSDLDRARALLRQAKRVTALTGAGVSAASGVPTFRGDGGLWRSFRPEHLATPQAFARQPDVVWEWYDWRRQIIRAAQPNSAHHVLAAWTRSRSGFSLITQNVDGLHERAGAEPLIRLHGSIWRLRCWQPCDPNLEWQDERTPLPERPPRCPRCGGLARPGVVWFGEPLDPLTIERASAAATQCDLFLSIGTSSIVYPAAGLIRLARSHGARIVEVNPSATDVSEDVDVALRQPAETALSALDDAS